MEKFYLYWAKYCDLGDRDRGWLQGHAEVLPLVKRGTLLFEEGNDGRYVFFVNSGFLAGVTWDEEGNRRIHHLAPQEHNLMTNVNLYTHKKIAMNIVALRHSEVLRLPVQALHDFKESCREGETLADVLRDKIQKQDRKHIQLLQIKDEKQRYISFFHECPELRRITRLQEQADYLNISMSTARRAIRIC
ncbi:cAMP-binding domain of CRP or a regulatory subunit of cAMP-dependent protein kinases [bacterium A37T11]|nr:cAMP-binding domain of CRP or a regulatory subunit of cAMP-dependent protein kinases [bacterium A37T11]